MTMYIWNIVLFTIIAAYLLHRIIRNASWNEKKELMQFESQSKTGPLHYYMRHGLTKLIVGILLIVSWQDLWAGWLWLTFGIFLTTLGVIPAAGLALAMLTKEPDFEWEPPKENEISAKVGKKRRSAILFFLLLLLWLYTGVIDVI